MPRRLFLLFAVLLAPLVVKADAPASLLPERLPEHPRLLARASDWADLDGRCSADAELAAYCEALVSYAHKLLSQPVLERKMTGRRLLHVSREAVKRVLILSFAYRRTGDRVFLSKAREELLAVCAFSDWNPSHFLDVAEMATAVGLGYDWLYNDLSAQDRAVLRAALRDKALVLVQGGHSTFRLSNNWSQVCIGGLMIAAFAVAEDERALSEAVLQQAKANVHWGLSPYAPDGVYPEGPSYWGFGTCYQILQLASLRSVLGQDWDIPKYPGFLRSAQFLAAASAPSGSFFNYADCGSNDEIFPALFYLARELKQPELVSGQSHLLRRILRKEARPDDRFASLLAFWWPFGAKGGAKPPLFFTGQGDNAVVMWRSAWNDPAAFYFAIKAGGAGVSHGHMDAGSFVLERDGLRWCEDLGMQDYESIESRGMKLWDRKQSSDRWTIFRLNNQSHNTLSVGGAPHNAAGLAKLLSADEKTAEIDLLPAFLPGAASSARRRVTLDQGHVILQDELSGLQPGIEVTWQILTKAVPETGKNAVLLRRGGKTLLLSYQGTPATAEVFDCNVRLAAWDAPNPGVKILLLRGKADEAGNWKLRVDFGRDKQP